MSRYAEGTKVSSDRSVAEIRKTLRKFGAYEFGYQEAPDQALIGFCFRGMRFEMGVPLPSASEKRFSETPTGKVRCVSASEAACEQEGRRRWRSLAAVIKALMIAINDEVLDFREALMPFIVWGNGKTIGKQLLPKIEEAVKAGALPRTMAPIKLLPQLE
ncbi:MAG TPA: hypothetical protein VMY35_03700 [Phycisphaerae bacterium]|nr:hypothetical protein [Phycisphaerae bacterium]